MLRRQQIGLNNTLLTQRLGPDLADVVPSDPFRAAFVRLKDAHGLYRRTTSGVTFLSPTLFRAGIPLPGEVPIGTYEVEVKLFSGGVLLTRTQTAFEIVKVGIRAGGRRRRAPQRAVLRPRHHDDGASHRLAGLGGVPQRLDVLVLTRFLHANRCPPHQLGGASLENATLSCR